MLRRSLLTVAILGAFVAVAGAHSGGEAEEARDLQTPELELVFEAPSATCAAKATEAPSEGWFERLLEEQSASRLEEVQARSLYARGWGGRRCFWCTPYGCFVVYC